MEINLGEEQKIVSEYKKNRVSGTYLLAWYLIRKHNIKQNTTTNEGNLFDQNEIKVDIQRILKELTSSYAKSETIFKIKHMII